VRLARVHGATESIGLVRALLAGAQDQAQVPDQRYRAALAGGLALADLTESLAGVVAAFARSGGYGEPDATRPPQWWCFSDESQDWRSGGNPGLQRLLADPGPSDETKRAYEGWIKQRGRDARRRPWFQDWLVCVLWILPNRPVIGVIWFEAMAFCAWPTDDLRGRGLLRDDQAIRLPTEIQWGRAARGTAGLRWPWGDDWQEGAANTEESGLSAISAVGLVPLGPADPSCDAVRGSAGILSATARSAVSVLFRPRG
jgi:hypothetical protein